MPCLARVASPRSSHRPTRIETVELTSTDERHLRRHYGHELNVRIQWQARHIDHSIGDMLHVHCWFRNSGAVRLQSSGCQFVAHLRNRVSNVNLTTRDVVPTAIQ